MFIENIDTQAIADELAIKDEIVKRIIARLLIREPDFFDTIGSLRDVYNAVKNFI